MLKQHHDYFKYYGRPPNSMKMIDCRAKPFIKWAGGKSQLLPQILPRVPEDCNKYIEPFIGGGAVLFSIADQFDEIYISDTNAQLIGVYKDIRDRIGQITGYLNYYQTLYLSYDQAKRDEYYYQQRDRYNELINEECVERSALFIFLNKTCFNGLYRVNAKGLHNVPAGRYAHPTICDDKNLRECSKLLRKAHICTLPFEKTLPLVTDKTFVYCDPPYRPLTQTASFNSYTKDAFDDACQARLAEYARRVTDKGGKILLSNSDPHNADPNDNFFDDLYSGFNICRIEANRMINSNAANRGKIHELLISNY